MFIKKKYEFNCINQKKFVELFKKCVYKFLSPLYFISANDILCSGIRAGTVVSQLLSLLAGHLTAISLLRGVSLDRVEAVCRNGGQGRGRPRPGFVRHAREVVVNARSALRSAVRRASVESCEHVEKGQGLPVSGKLQGRKMGMN